MKSILDHQHAVIFGYPRSATKLTARILEEFGYHNYGEYFDTWTSTMAVDGIDRISPSDMARIRDIGEKNWPNAELLHLTALTNRRRKWLEDQSTRLGKWTITIWQENLTIWPSLLFDLSGCVWLCTRRKDRFDQLISFVLISINGNPDGGQPTMPVYVSKEHLSKFYWKLERVELMQDDMIRRGNGILVDFDQLITGRFEGFGSEYMVPTTDQHQDPISFVKNQDDVISWYNELESISSSIDRTITDVINVKGVKDDD